MTTYTVEYTETENKAMAFAAADVNDWIQNAAHERARIAIDEIVAIAVQKFLEAGQSIPGSKDEIVSAAFTNGWVKTAQQRNEESLNNTIQPG
jgi:phage portal protein BeeE